MSNQAEINRLRWRCRRGTTELDRLFSWYLDYRYLSDDSVMQAQFSDLLQEQDPQLWDWLMGRSVPDNLLWRKIIHVIRTEHQL